MAYSASTLSYSNVLHQCVMSSNIWSYSYPSVFVSLTGISHVAARFNIFNILYGSVATGPKQTVHCIAHVEAIL